MLAFLAAQPPSPALALAVSADPAALAEAETRCRMAAMGAACREVLRVTAGCGALVHGARDPRLVPAPHNPQIPVSVKTAASAPTRDAAERDAMQQCRQRDRGATCLVVAAGCVGAAPFIR